MNINNLPKNNFPLSDYPSSVSAAPATPQSPIVGAIVKALTHFVFDPGYAFFFALKKVEKLNGKEKANDYYQQVIRSYPSYARFNPKIKNTKLYFEMYDAQTKLCHALYPLFQDEVVKQPALMKLCNKINSYVTSMNDLFVDESFLNPTEIENKSYLDRHLEKISALRGDIGLERPGIDVDSEREELRRQIIYFRCQEAVIQNDVDRAAALQASIKSENPLWEPVFTDRKQCAEYLELKIKQIELQAQLEVHISREDNYPFTARAVVAKISQLTSYADQLKSYIEELRKAPSK